MKTPIYRWDKKSKKKVLIKRKDFTKTKKPDEFLGSKSSNQQLLDYSKNIFKFKNPDAELKIKDKDTFFKKIKKLSTSKINAANGSKRLQKTTPFSEQWFLDSLRVLKFPHLTGAYQTYQLGLGIQNAHYENYIPDFINHEYKFIIEIDDSSHLYKKDYDRRRDAYFQDLGFSIYRIQFKSIDSLLSNMVKICHCILSYKDNNSAPLKNWLNYMLKQQTSKTVK